MAFKFNPTTGKLDRVGTGGGGGTPLEVKTQDGNVDVSSVSTIKVPNYILVNEGGATVSILSDKFINAGEADTNIVSGQPLYLKNNSHVDLAQADDISTTRVVGLALNDTLTTFSCKFVTNGFIEINDWSAITGSATLSINAPYYLSPGTAGQLTTIAPTTIGQFVVKVGQAISDTILSVEIEESIKL